MDMNKENIDLQHFRCTAMLLGSEDDCVLLAQSLSDDEAADYKGWDDNGGDPDGPDWLFWPCDDTLIAHADRLRIPYEVVAGFELPYPSEIKEAYTRQERELSGHWSGISCEECMFVVNENDAVEIMRSVSGIES